MIEVYEVKTFDEDVFYATIKQGEAIKNAVIKKIPNASFLLGDNLLKTACVKSVKIRVKEIEDLPKYILNNIETKKEESTLEKEPDGEKIGLTVRCFDVDGNVIADPSKSFSMKYEDRPKDFVMIKQYQHFQYIRDKNGNLVKGAVLGNPIEETFYGWRWDENVWDCVMYMLVLRGRVEIDNRPEWYKFVQNFRRPDLHLKMKLRE